MGSPYWVLFIILIPTLIIFGGIYIIESSYDQKVQHEILEMNNQLNFQKQKIESDFTLTIKAQEGFTKLPEWNTLTHADLFDSEIGGIPQDVESDKRRIAKYLISEFGFQSFGITTLDGQMYLLEPFSDQLALSKYNFADREWFQGVLTSKDTFVSDVFVSSATNHPIIVMSTPLLAEDGKLIGMWGGGIDLEFLTSYLDGIRNKATSIILVDNNDIVIANTHDINYHGKASDMILEFELNEDLHFYDSNSDTHVFHTTINLQTKEWSLFATISENDFLIIEKQKKVEAYVLLGTMQVFLVIITFFIFRNVQKNHQLTQKLQENQEQVIKQERLSAIGELSARIAHDIKNPLSNIKLSKDLLDRKISDEKLKPYFEKIDKNIFRITHQVDDVLDFLKKNPMKKQEINIRTLIDNSINGMQIPKNVSIDVSECTFKTNIDQIKMERVFSNLLLNSIQAIGDKNGKISIIISEIDYQCCIIIQDSGDGIDLKIKNKIFEPLFTTKMNGTGLGLATVKNIIEMHNGSITVDTNPTRFTIKIPKF